MIKSEIMNFVESKSTATRHEILEFLFALKGKTFIPKIHRGYYRSAFCPGTVWDPAHCGHLLRPSKREPRYLSRIGRGIYTVKTV